MTRIALIGLMTAIAPVPAAAQTLTATVTVTLADFASEKSRAMLDARIRSAIESVCGSYAAIESYQVPAMDACWKDARAQVATKVAEFRAKTTVRLGSR
jgi:UrcA family protein